MKKKKIKYIYKVFNLLAITLLAILGLLCVLILIGSSKTTFNVIASSEQVEFYTNSELDSKWKLDNVLIKEDVFIDSIYNFSGSIIIPLNSTVIISRVSYGPIKVSFEKLNDKVSIALYDDNREYVKTFTSDFEIYIENTHKRTKLGETIMFPLNGLKGKFGTSKTISHEVESTVPILRSGKVKLMNRSIFNSGLTETGSFDLQLGDQFVIDEPNNTGFGFIVINEEPNLMITYSVLGENCKIIKPGNIQRNISISVFNKILNDNFLSMISIVLAAVIVLITLLTFYIDYTLFIYSFKRLK